MSEDPTRSQSDMESLLAEAVDEYRALVRRGTRPGVEPFVARYPSIAHALRPLLPALTTIDGMSADDLHAAAEEAPEHRALGDFAIGREIGRGGMGVVYEAEQISLARRVALKVLPFAAVMDPRQLQRFKNEAQAAAHLHHTNIVPVHSIGCERGVHYYAMQYIEGLTVAQIIQALRAREGRATEKQGARLDESSSAAVDALTSGSSTQSPAFCKAVARLGIQAAEALDHAHQQGVIHRDIKPGNLIIDAGSTLWVTDFGLASFRSAETRSLTMAGDLLGTLRYMSPEQALAKRVPIDHRTDTYSLGATLYEFLTLEHAVTGTGSQQILQDLAFKEPRRARDLNPAIPEDLETILMKAMAKSPAERYETAQTLADDLRRFLELKPIEARRPTVLQRGAKWCGRHRALVGVAAVFGVVAVISLSIGTALIQSAYHAETEQRERAERNLATAREAVERMMGLVIDDDLADVGQVDPVRRKILTEALAFYERVLEENAGDPTLRLDAARASQRAGDIQLVLGRLDAAESAYRRALVLADTETGAPAGDAGVEIAVVYRRLADTLRAARRAAEAQESARHAVAIAEAAAEYSGAPRHRLEVALCRRSLGRALHEAEAEQEADLEAEAEFRRALAIHEELTAALPGDPSYAAGRAGALADLGENLDYQHRVGEAEAAYLQSLEVYRELVAAHPGVASYRWRLARVNFNLAWTLQQPQSRGVGPEPVGGRAEILAAYAASVDLAKGLFADFPEEPRHKALLGDSLRMLAMHSELHQKRQLFEDAIRLVPEDASNYLDLAWSYATCPREDERDVARALSLADQAVRLAPHGFASWGTLGAARYRDGDYVGACEALEKALSLGAAAPRPRSPGFTGADHPRIWFYLAMTKWQLGETERALSCFDSGLDAIKRQRSERPHDRRRRFRVEAALLLGVADEADLAIQARRERAQRRRAQRKQEEER